MASLDEGVNKSIGGFGKLFGKGGEEPATAEVPQVPIERTVSSPRRTVGKGRRDTVLNGGDGLP